MEDNKLFGLVWKLVALVLCTIIVSLASCSAYQAKRVADAIEGGSDPLDARCAIYGSNERDAVCVLRASRK